MNALDHGRQLSLLEPPLRLTDLPCESRQQLIALLAYLFAQCVTSSSSNPQESSDESR